MSESGGESIIGKFFGVLGFKVDHAGVEEFQNSLNHVKHAVEGIFAIEVIERVAHFVERSVGAAAAMNDMSEMTGIARENLIALERVAIDNSVSFDSMKSSVVGLYRAIGQAQAGTGRYAKILQDLGIKVKEGGKNLDTETVIGNIAERLKQASKAERIGIGARLGLDPMVAKTLGEQGRGFVEEIRKAIPKNILQPQDLERADEAEKTFKRLSMVTHQLGTLVAVTLQPALKKVVDTVEAFVLERRTQLVHGLNTAVRVLGQVLSRVWEWGSKVYEVIEKITKAITESHRTGQVFRALLVGIVAINLSKSLLKSAEAVKALAKAFRSMPGAVSIIALLAVGVGLLVEDFMAWKKGEESVFADLNEKWPNAVKAISKAMEGLLEIWNSIVAAARELGIINKEAPKQGSMAWYKEMKAHPPKAGTPEAQQFAEMEATIAKGEHPWQQLMRNIQYGTTVQAPPIPADWTQLMGKVNAEGATATGQTTVYHVTGTKVQVMADTPERARDAGKSVREALAPQQVRNYQPRSL